jgi:asparagine synthase (glutamine-hydrolysing)
MCGIAGIYSPEKSSPSERTLRRMLYHLQHRGPDEFGIYLASEIGFAHARLSIIDIATGQQPMCNEDGSLWIVFNGEIFNYIELKENLLSRGHVFKTGSDTEVILHQYEEEGPASLNAFNGQFAFAIWDTRKRELFLARDRIGICPLFYTKTGREFIFASEAKAILSHDGVSRQIDATSLDDVFTFWFPISSRSAFRGINEIPPGHYMKIGKEGEVVRRYWDLPEGGDFGDGRDEKYYAEGLRDLLVDSTRLRLRADVPVGAYLSGGLDSSVLASIIRNHTNTHLRTFSVTFDDPEFDESPKQRAMVEFLGTEHESAHCCFSDIADSFKEVVWHAEVPIVRTAPVPLLRLSRLVRESGFKVVLTGEGADEILAGYDIFKEAKIRWFMMKEPDSRFRYLLLQRLYPYLSNSPTRFLAFAKSFFGAPADPFPEEFQSHAPRWKITEMGKAFYSKGLREELGTSDPVTRIFDHMDGANRSGKLDPMAWWQEIEIKTLLPRYLLSSQGDRMLMANSVEGRFPFLDHRVIEFCLNVPPNLRMKGLTEKYLLRKSMADALPADIVKMVKQPYRAPDAGCFFGKKEHSLVEEELSEETLRKSGYFDSRKVAMLLEKCRKGSVIGFKDNMAFIAILSTQILDRLFLREFDGTGEIQRERVRVERAHNRN